MRERKKSHYENLTRLGGQWPGILGQELYRCLNDFHVSVSLFRKISCANGYVLDIDAASRIATLLEYPKQ